ncbi:MAG: exodeoxyribonuclease VII large subunit [Huintestinicola sp.]
MSSILTVTQLNRYMSFRIKDDPKLRSIMIRGEISGFKHHSATGHFYFTLKDEASALKAVMFNSFASRVKFMPQNGMSVIAVGSIQVFERDGVYQLYVTDMQPEGVGALYLAAEQLKEKLSAEGLFDERFKKPIPRFPSKIGIVTAKSGAALQDILNILGRRYPVCSAVIFPCLVQGEYAPPSICEALRDADRSGCDVIICGRGGGSAEDLSAFNSEDVARCVFDMQTPVISAVGHETDITVIDFVSDLRAPTPSAAAELAVPDMTALYDSVDMYEKSLSAAFGAYIARRRRELHEIENRLNGFYPAAKLAQSRERVSSLEARLSEAMKVFLAKKDSEIAKRAARLDELSPLKIMARGYSLVYKGEQLIKTADSLRSGDEITVRFADGSAEAVIR